MKTENFENKTNEELLKYEKTLKILTYTLT